MSNIDINNCFPVGTIELLQTINDKMEIDVDFNFLVVSVSLYIFLIDFISL